MWLVLAEGMAFPAAGLVVGIAASVALTRVLQLSLYETSPLDARVFLSMTGLFAAAAIAAGLIQRGAQRAPIQSSCCAQSRAMPASKSIPRNH